ncbi:filamentous hemagglutinin family protein [Methylobacillus gramineus]|uniref:filamentous haemagglutinin family protein n=1 Tax=Methylobacillus gramineus TaxID=755169 RepID=UPI001CFF7C20|nr:filamentous haemagglutinin family protein [Methylobacillus gramineus]MCB5186042.1 filamentous hemagglutinin family protein [Methylobacillus gramineus]
MNQGLFRLVFNKRLGIYVPAHEMAHATASAGRNARARRRVMAALIASLAAGHALADVVPLASSGLVPGGGAWSNAYVSVATPTITTIQQSAPQAIANWSQFNLARNHTLNINQQSNWQMLHRIHDLNPSIIAGTINAPGTNYFVNTNGIIFANGAQINVGSLLAVTSADMTDALFTNGLLSSLSQDPVFRNTGGFIKVEAGAALTAASGGRIMLLAKDVENHGVIKTPDGQTILAAGEKVYLKSSTDPAGLLVEVDAGGTATNLGEIVADRGNVTLVGLAVNQQGRISASTSVRANGSIHLLARDSVNAIADGKGGYTYQPSRYGKVTIGKGSVTEVRVETADKEEVLASQTLAPSRINIEGRTVEVNGLLRAKGGQVNIAAKSGEESNQGVTTPVRVLLDDNARIDVSGVDATAAMEKNQLQVQLYSDQLKDTPILRGGALFGETVYLDARKGTDLFDVSPLLALRTQTIAEKMSKAGTINISSAGDVVTKSGSVMDVSGGVIDYAAGYIRESKLIYQGRAVAISQADRNTPYEGLADVYKFTDPKWGWTKRVDLNPNGRGTWQQAYREGRDAGTININSTNPVLLNGNMQANTRSDVTQRTNLPDGGNFNLTTGTGVVRIQATATQVPAGFTINDANPGTETILGTGLLQSGFNHLGINSQGSIEVDTAVVTAPNGSVNLKGGGVNINKDIVTPGGDITVATQLANQSVVVDDGVKLSSAGNWNNDNPALPGAMQTPIALDGGSINLSASENLMLGKGSLLDASAGAWVDSSGVLHTGNGGDITLSAQDVKMGAQLQSYGFTQGGKLSVSTAQNVQVGGQPASAGDFWVRESFFEQGGFVAYTINNSRNGGEFVVGDASGKATVIHPKMQALMMSSGYSSKVSGTSMAEVSKVVLLPEGQRGPASVSFSALGDATSLANLTVLRNTIIRTDAPDITGRVGAIALEASRQLTMMGSLLAPAGNISLKLSGDVDQVPYDNQQSIWIGDQSVISVKGSYVRPVATAPTLASAKVLDGGNITVDAHKGFVVAEEGSLMDVSGTSGAVDVNTGRGLQRQLLDGGAGTVSITARDGMILDGNFLAGANGAGEAGTLKIALTGDLKGTTQTPGHPSGERVLTVTTDKQLLATGLQARDNLAAFEGKAQMSTEQINAGQFDHVSLESTTQGREPNATERDRIVLQSGVTLSAPETLALTSSAFEVSGSGVAQINASHVTLATPEVNNTVQTGDAILKVNADWIDLNGTINLSGIKQAELNSRLDIRGRGLTFDNAGSLKTNGNLLMTARQIYPVSNSSFNIEALGSNSNITVRSSGEAYKPVFSAGGKLGLKAHSIRQEGVLLAPLGQIALDAASQSNLVLGEKSLTSVSAAGLSIPYGTTQQGGTAWNLPNNIGTKPLEKRITLNGQDIDLKSGAVIDISGSGDTFAYEWIQGIGGSRDILAQSGVYALLPSIKGEYAPFDYDYTKDNAPAIGQAVYLSGIAGLPAGYYTLLPARYALLQGAYMLQLGSGQQVRQGTNTQLMDGSSLVSGYLTNVNNSSRNATWDTFRITNGSVFRTPSGSVTRAPSEYMISSGNAFFAQQAASAGLAVPRLAGDAGQLVLSAIDTLQLNATLKTDKAAGGRGAMVDIVSDKISVVSDVGADNGSLQLSADSLNNMNAESILLGGSRTQGDQSVEISTTSTEVRFANDADHALKVNQLIATASDRVTVENGAVIQAESAANQGSTNLRVNGDGALLAVSGSSDIVFDRAGASSNPNLGTLDIQAGSQIRAARSLVLDATHASSLNGNVSVSDGGSVTLGASSILLGSPGAVVPGMRVDNTLVASLGNLKQVTLNSHGNLNLYGEVDFGSRNLDVTINAAGIVGHDMAAGDTSNLTANHLVMKNSAGAALIPTVSSTRSTLAIDASSISVEGKNTAASNNATNAGNFALSGFEQVQLNSSRDITFSGSGTLDIHATDTRISSGRITAATGTNYTLNTQGALTTLANSSAAQAATAGLGAKLNLVAQQMTLGGNIYLASGQLTARSTQGDLNVTGDARINTASRAIRFDRFTRHTPGGVVSLQSDQADINVASGASIDVSGGEGGNAGTLKMTAKAGEVNIAAGTLHGQAGQGQTAGSFVMDSASLTDFSGLNNALNSGGFNASQELRIRNGDVAIAAGDTVEASRFVLSADGGAIDIAGTVDASGKHGGDVQVYAKNDLTLQAGGKLLANAEATDGKGGSVLLASESGTVKAQVFETDGVTRRQDAALIDVSGSQLGDVTLRAERVGASGLKVDVDAPAAVAGADKILLESVKVMNVATTLNATTLNTIRTDTNAFYADAGNTAGTYKASSDGVSAIVAPHTELRTTDNTTLANDWNLRDLSLGRDGVLTIRSTGNLQLNGSISDGFANATVSAALASGDSWSINLVSGADMSAVNHLSTLKSDTAGNMVLANNKLVRTGTGDINIATGGNLTLSNAGSVIYTAGNAAADLAGFVAPTSTDGFGTNGAQYLTQGGDLNIATQGDITGALAAASGTQQIVNNWLFRQGGGSGNKDTTWWLRTDLFQQGVASFGGGDVAVKAGGNITNFSVSVPTTARFTRDGSGNSDVSGGGNLNVVAEGDIRNGMYFAGKGHVDLQAGGEIGRTFNAQGNPITFGTTLALQDATASVTASAGVYLETVFNPTLFAQSTTNAGPTGVANSTGRSAFFNSYADNAAIDVASLTGAITFGLDQLSNITGKLTGLATVNSTQNSLAFYPGSVQATAFGGDIYTGNMKLMPSATGELGLLAAGSIIADQIVMSDAERSLIPSVSSPIQSPQVILENIIMNSHSAIPLHRNSSNPVSIVARDGSLRPWRTQTVSLTLPKTAVVMAGLDILNLDANLQNMDSADLSVVRAGRDISYVNVQAGGINVSGPGNLLVEAGRNLDLGRSNGINSLANTVNAGLPAQGASITVLAGVGKGASLDDYINLYIKPDGSGPSVLSGNEGGMAEYRAATAQALAKYMREITGEDSLSEADALTRYLALEKDQQAIFAYRHFSSELLASGKAYATTQSHARGDAAVASLWQGDYKGDMSLFQSRIRTVRDGSIDLLAPGGMINVGVAGGTSSGNIGIVTEGGGDIRAFADSGFQVNQSRVITQYGSDITVWVNNGDIDAGRGSKTALSIPEVEISTDVYGNTTRKVKGAAAGSGIQAQTYDADGPDGPSRAPRLGSVALMAPRGVLNASEAGIVAGDFLAVATQVLGTSNINVAGTSTGVPAADTGSLAAANVGTTGTASSATSAVADMSRLAPPQDFSPRNLLPSFVSVEVLGLGDIMR